MLLAAWRELRRVEPFESRLEFNVSTGNASVVKTRVVGMDGNVVTESPNTSAKRRTVAIPAGPLPEMTGHFDEYVAAGPTHR